MVLTPARRWCTYRDPLDLSVCGRRGRLGIIDRRHLAPSPVPVLARPGPSESCGSEQDHDKGRIHRARAGSCAHCDGQAERSVALATPAHDAPACPARAGEDRAPVVVCELHVEDAGRHLPYENRSAGAIEAPVEKRCGARELARKRRIAAYHWVWDAGDPEHCAGLATSLKRRTLSLKAKAEPPRAKSSATSESAVEGLKRRLRIGTS